MKISQTILTIFLTSSTLHVYASQIDNQSKHALVIKTFEKLADHGVQNIGTGLLTMHSPRTRDEFTSAYPFEVRAGKIVYGAAQIAYGTSQILIGQTIKYSIENPSEAGLVAISLTAGAYAVSNAKKS